MGLNSTIEVESVVIGNIADLRNWDWDLYRFVWNRSFFNTQLEHDDLD